MTVPGRCAAILGAILWSAVSIALTVAALREMPEGESLGGLTLYLIGFLPGLWGTRRLAIANMEALAAQTSQVPIWRLFLPRFWLIMVIMFIIMQLLRFLPVNAWLRIAYALISASALLCGALTFTRLAYARYPMFPNSLIQKRAPVIDESLEDERAARTNQP
ncbi:MAG: hypothetical protein AB1649_18580 [Chloroflexota bacterium]